jgi:molybdopterin synthase catalytic subunit
MSEQKVRLTTDVLDVAAVIAEVQHGGAGGLAVFVGLVRDHAAGKPVVTLEYEAYAPMAVREMQRCVDEIENAYGVVRLAVHHRVGTLRVGEAAVVCAASAPHRREAFTACHGLIDAVKARVPIWKREHGPEGAYWVGWVDARCGDPAHDHDRDHAHDHPGLSAKADEGEK